MIIGVLFMNLGLNNKVVVVTGASKGIGKAIASNFAKEKAIVVICSRNIDNLINVAETIEEKTESWRKIIDV